MTQPHFPQGSPVPASPAAPPVGPPHAYPGQLQAHAGQQDASHPGQPPAAPARPARRRITGIDVARAVAIIGMLVAHLGTGHHSLGGGWGEQWMWIFDGRSSALFATLAGLSIALMTRSIAPADRLGWRGARVKIAVRAAILLPLGLALQLLGTPVVVILPAYAVMFLMTIPVVRLRSGWLLGIAALGVTLGPLVVLGLRQAVTQTVHPTQVFFSFGWGELIAGYYPALVWIAYVLVGLVVGRGALASPRYAAALLGAGVALAALAYGLGAVLTANLASGAAMPGLLVWPDVLVSVEPHADSGFEVAGNIGVALAVIGLCLLATSARPGELALAPLAALGSMSLTIYTAQLVVIAALGQDAVYYPASNVPLIVLALASIAFAWGWRAVLGRGPLERLLKAASDASAARVVA